MGCGGTFLLIIICIILIVVTGSIIQIKISDKKEAEWKSAIAVFIIGIVGFVFYVSYTPSNNYEQQVRKEAGKTAEIDSLKKRIETDGYLGLSDTQLEKVYGDPILQNKIGDGLWSLTFSFGTVTTKNGTVVSAPNHGIKNKDESAAVKSVQLKRGTIRVKMTSDVFVNIVRLSDIESQASEPDLVIPDSLIVTKFCKVDGKEFQVRLARTSYNGPYRITNIWLTKPKKSD